MKYILILLSLLPLSVLAQWYQITHKVELDTDYKIEDARKLILYQIIDKFSTKMKYYKFNFELLDKYDYKRKLMSYDFNNQINKIEIQEEYVKENVLYTTALINYDEILMPCPFYEYSREISVGRFKIKNPEQALVGAIFEIETAYQRIFKENIKLKQYPVRINDNLSDKKGLKSQYTLNGYLHDISVEKTEVNNVLAISGKTKLNRNIKLEIQVFDNYQNILIFNNIYSAKFKWEYAYEDKVDVHSKEFWNSIYGKALRELSRRVLLELSKEIECEEIHTKVIDMNKNGIVLNIGSRNGIKLGDKFTNISNIQSYDLIEKTKDLYIFKAVEVKLNKTTVRNNNPDFIDNIRKLDVFYLIDASNN